MIARVGSGAGVLLALMLQWLRGYGAFSKTGLQQQGKLFVRECSVHDRVKAFTVIEERAVAWAARDRCKGVLLGLGFLLGLC